MAFIKITELSSLEEGKINSYTLKYYDLAIVKIGNQIHAFEDKCSHDGSSISDGELQGDKIICPRHYAEFSLQTGEALTMPATESIQIFPVRVIGNIVEVDLD